MRILATFLILFLAMPCFSTETSKIIAGNKAYDKEKYGEAFNFYNAASQDGKEALKAQYNTGAALYRLKDYKASAKAYDAALKDKNLEQAAYFNRGDALYMAGDTPKALDSFRNAILMGNGNTAAIHNMQFILTEQDKKDGDKDNKGKDEKPDASSDKGQGESDNSKDGQGRDKPDAGSDKGQGERDDSKDGQGNEKAGKDGKTPDAGEQESEGNFQTELADRIMQLANESSKNQKPLNSGTGEQGLNVSKTVPEKDW